MNCRVGHREESEARPALITFQLCRPHNLRAWFSFYRTTTLTQSKVAHGSQLKVSPHEGEWWCKRRTCSPRCPLHPPSCLECRRTGVGWCWLPPQSRQTCTHTQFVSPDRTRDNSGGLLHSSLTQVDARGLSVADHAPTRAVRSRSWRKLSLFAPHPQVHAKFTSPRKSTLPRRARSGGGPSGQDRDGSAIYTRPRRTDLGLTPNPDLGSCHDSNGVTRCRASHPPRQGARGWTQAAVADKRQGRR